MESIYWHDYETTGTDPARDRAIQFAGIRTDHNLQPVGEPLNLLCRPGNDILPSPEAIAVTGIRMSDVVRDGLSEVAFIDRIHREFSVPKTCVSGFNSIRFDDEFTRHMLYRNFFDPYAREWQQGNSRWDVIDLFRMAHALRPDGMEWPKNDKGAPSFRLEALTEANGISHGAAHDALSDVLATVALTRKLKDTQQKLYDYLFALRDKKRVLQQLYPLGKFPLVHVSAMYPAERACTAVVLPLCTHPLNANGVICYDLSMDPATMASCDAAELQRLVFTANDDLGDEEERIALKTIHVNRAPAIAPIATLRDADAARLGLDRGQWEGNLRTIQHTPGIVEKIQEAFSSTQFERTQDPDLMLYQGDFFSSTDKAMMSEIHDLAPEMLRDSVPPFQDKRLPEMLFRFRARNYPETLSGEEQSRWNEYRRLLWRNGELVDERLAEIDAMTKEGPVDCLEDLRSYILSLKAEVL